MSDGSSERRSTGFGPGPPRGRRGPRPRRGARLLPGHPGAAGRARPARPRVDRVRHRVPARGRVQGRAGASRPTTRPAWPASSRRGGGVPPRLLRGPGPGRRAGRAGRRRASSSSTGRPGRAPTARSRSSIPGARTACSSSWSRRRRSRLGDRRLARWRCPMTEPVPSPGRLGRPARHHRRSARHRARHPGRGTHLGCRERGASGGSTSRAGGSIATALDGTRPRASPWRGRSAASCSARRVAWWAPRPRGSWPSIPTTAR